MSIYANRFVVCMNNDEATIEFFLDEPVPSLASADAAKIEKTASTSVAKVVLPKRCAQELYAVLPHVLSDNSN